jgi:hypothetical protein
VGLLRESFAPPKAARVPRQKGLKVLFFKRKYTNKGCPKKRRFSAAGSGASFDSAGRAVRVPSMQWLWRLTILMLLAAQAPLMAGADLASGEVGETFENQSVWGVLSSALPSSVKQDWGPTGTAEVTPFAAHRDQQGLRLQSMVRRQLPDGGSRAGLAEGPSFIFTGAPSLVTPNSPLYFRLWMRVNTQVTASRLVWFAFSSENGLTLDPLPGGWRVRIAEDTNTNNNLPYNELMQPMNWHLIEVEYVRGRAADGKPQGGSLRIWLDGQLHTLQANLGSSLRTQVRSGAVEYLAGIIEHLNQDYTGSVDIDDFRRSRRPPASTLQLEAVATQAPALCPDVRQVKLRLLSSQGTAAAAPYAFTPSLDAGSELQVGVLSAEGCFQAGPAALASGADTVLLAVKGRPSGTVSATWPDFIGASVALPGTKGEPPQPLLGCGCGEAGQSWALLLLWASQRLTSRRRSRKASTSCAD